MINTFCARDEKLCLKGLRVALELAGCQDPQEGQGRKGTRESKVTMATQGRIGPRGEIDEPGIHRTKGEKGT